MGSILPGFKTKSQKYLGDGYGYGCMLLTPHEGSGDDGDGSTREDLLILSAILWGVDIMEIYSLPMVTEVCKKYWLEPGESLHLKTG